MPLATQERQQLADAFRRRGMHQHIQSLFGRRWDADFEVEWMRYLHVPPYEHDYPVLPRGSPCPRCAVVSPDRTATGTYVPCSFPGGWAERCVGCQATWVHVERP